MTPESPQSCLVTGAHGFLGRRVVSEFARAGYRVVGVDRGESADAVTGMDAYRRLELPDSAFADLLGQERPDVVIHTAGPASVADSMAHPERDFQGTVGVLFGVLDAVRLASPDSRLVMMSSAAVYGNPSTLPVSEGAALAPVSPYGFHKEMAEDILREFHDVYGIRSCAARVFSAYGSGLRRQLLWDVCQKVVAGPIVTLFGTGAETRDFIHVEDVARAIRVLAENAEMNAEVYNVASGHQTTIESVARALVSSLDPQIEVRFSGEQRPGDPLHWEADISAVSGLGFHAQVSFEDGVADYARWFVEENRT